MIFDVLSTDRLRFVFTILKAMLIEYSNRVAVYIGDAIKGGFSLKKTLDDWCALNDYI